MCHYAFICVTWLFICMTWLILTRDKTHSHVCYHSSTCVQWSISIYEDLFILVTRLLPLCDMTSAYAVVTGSHMHSSHWWYLPIWSLFYRWQRLTGPYIPRALLQMSRSFVNEPPKIGGFSKRALVCDASLICTSRKFAHISKCQQILPSLLTRLCYRIFFFNIRQHCAQQIRLDVCVCVCVRGVREVREVQSFSVVIGVLDK